MRQPQTLSALLSRDLTTKTQEAILQAAQVQQVQEDLFARHQDQAETAQWQHHCATQAQEAIEQTARPAVDFSKLGEFRMKLNRQGQSTIEYAVLIIIVVTACAAMTTYVYRAVQANLKVVEESINAEPD
jgi:hypothetical protein